MKKILTILLAGVTTLASAQKKINLSRSIEDDGHRLSIRVNGTIDGKAINYERTFKVAGLSKSEKAGLAEHILDSLGVGSIQPPVPPRPPAHLSAAASNGYEAVAAAERDTEHSHSQKPFSKEVKFNEASGELYLRYQFVKDGEDFVYEKTVDAGSKSPKQRDSIIRNFEREIDLPVQ